MIWFELIPEPFLLLMKEKSKLGKRQEWQVLGRACRRSIRVFLQGKRKRDIPVDQLRGAIKYLREILDLLGDKRRKLLWLLILFLSSSVLDILGLGLIGPYVSLLSDPNSGGGFIQSIASPFGVFREETDLLLIGGLFLVGIFMAKTVLVIVINDSIIKFSQDQMVRLRSSLMQRFQNLDYTEYLCRNTSEYINSLVSLVEPFGERIRFTWV